MSYVYPPFDEADESFAGDSAYTYPSFDAADDIFAPETPPVNAADLVFQTLASSSANLVFGGEGDVALPTATFSITGSFAPLTVSALVVPVTAVEITGSFAPLTVSASVEYRSNTARPLVNQVASSHQQMETRQNGVVVPHDDASASPAGWHSPHTYGTGTSLFIESLLPNVLKQTRVGANSEHQSASPVRNGINSVHQDADRSLRLALNSAFEAASQIRAATAFRHQDGTRTRTERKSSAQEASPLRVWRSTRAQTATPMSKLWMAHYQEARRPPPGISVTPTEPPQPPYTCYTPNGDLLFELPWTGGGFLLFKCDGDTVTPPPGPGETIIVPVREVYIVTNNVTLRRASDNALIEAPNMTLSLDVDSWTWSFEATVPGAYQALIEPTITGPVELKCSVNGTEFRVLAERISRERTFGRTSLRVSGRGKNAILDSPYAPIQTFGNTIDRTAQQLMGDVLSFNGVPLPWSVTWQLTDWLVPAGVFSHQGSYITGLGAIVKAAGGFLLPHPTANSFTAKHLYPTAPWAWGGVTPDFVLPADVTTREGLEWIEKPEYNRVYVAGQKDGVLGRVTRSGTDGSLAAPMVVDQLITHADAARQRGIAILGDTGRQIRVDLRLPVLSETGIIQPGSFVRYEDGGVTRLGIVRGTSVDMQLASVWQNLEVETHA